MAGMEVLAVLLVATLEPLFAEFCKAYAYPVWGSGVRKFHCSFGCCGPAFDEYCCSGNAGMIAGIVFGAICIIAMASTAVCCCIKHAGHRGRVIHPAGTYLSSGHTTHANIFVVSPGTSAPPHYSSDYLPQHSNVHTPYPYRDGPGAPLPPAYSQTGAPLPPAYSQTAAPPIPPAYSQTSDILPPPYSRSGTRPHTTSTPDNPFKLQAHTATPS